MMSTSNNDNDNKAVKKRWSRRILMYVGVLLLFVAYFAFVSDNNYKTHRRLNEQTKQYEQVNADQKALLDKARKYENIHKDTVLMEQYRREKLNLKKENEDVFIIK